LGPGEQPDLAHPRGWGDLAVRGDRGAPVPPGAGHPAGIPARRCIRGRTGRRPPPHQRSDHRGRNPVSERALGEGGEAEEQSKLLSHSAVMAAGTTLSRFSGFLRAALLSYALGASVHADVFNVSNTIPTALSILLAGGVVNAVLVPQLVRAMHN